MKILIGIFATLIILSTSNCENNSENKNLMEIKGVIQEQGITSYQYGTHTITAGDDFYALRSKTLDLDEFIGEEVTISAEKISGYPVDGGPDFLEVEKVDK